jgi:hypothetical protein
MSAQQERPEYGKFTQDPVNPKPGVGTVDNPRAIEQVKERRDFVDKLLLQREGLILGLVSKVVASKGDNDKLTRNFEIGAKVADKITALEIERIVLNSEIAIYKPTQKF